MTHVVKQIRKQGNITAWTPFFIGGIHGYRACPVLARVNTSAVCFNKWQSLLQHKQRGMYSFSWRYCHSRKLLKNKKAVLYSRFSGFGLLCFLRDIFTTHSTNTCQHCSRDTSAILPDAPHTSATHSVLRVTEAGNSCEYRCTRSDATWPATRSTSLVSRTWYTLFTVAHRWNKLKNWFYMQTSCCVIFIEFIKVNTTHFG
jgi:hypothetical protein